MNFLAIDTSGSYLAITAFFKGENFEFYEKDCALKHSVRLMDEIQKLLLRAQALPSEFDCFAAVVGPGSFTGVRIGIATVKGLCLACGKPALAVTSFDALAYNEACSAQCFPAKDRRLALVDAGHDCFYACGYGANNEIILPPVFLEQKKVNELIEEGFYPIAQGPIFSGCGIADPACGLSRAVLAKKESLIAPSLLKALYLRKSSAEENRK